MDNNQKINCKVETCMYNNAFNHICKLDNIMVQPCKNCNNGNPADESMCGNYKHIK